MSRRAPGRLVSSPAVTAPTAEPSSYARWLLALAGHESEVPPTPQSSPHEEWAASGAMELTGAHDGPPLSPGWNVASAMRGAARALHALGGPSVDGPALLGERAVHTGFSRNGPTSPGGSCRILSTADGWIALNLARPSDVGLANAWLDDAGFDARDPWPGIARTIEVVPTSELMERAGGLGLALSALGEFDRAVPFMITGPGGARAGGVPFVVDLSALWAGPLCANLLAASGARVVKVESPTRPDAMRRGSSSFFEMLHRGHEQLVLAITEPKGLSALRRLLDAADIVVEASRPRALAQLGINAWDYVERGATWVSITGYGRAQPERVGFGDDVGVAAGLVAGDVDAPMFCADAIADPIAGLHAAVAAMAVLARGGGRLIDVSMAGAARTARGGRFVDATSVAVAPPRSRPWR
jgi:hypothetical protein